MKPKILTKISSGTRIELWDHLNGNISSDQRMCEKTIIETFNNFIVPRKIIILYQKLERIFFIYSHIDFIILLPKSFL
jgi:hypothetical protein